MPTPRSLGALLAVTLLFPIFQPSEPVLAKEVITNERDVRRGRARDRDITRMIREELQAESGLSSYAKNVKIVTLGGLVTLRGPVISEAERIKIESIAREVAGNPTVKNQLRVRAE